MLERDARERNCGWKAHWNGWSSLYELKAYDCEICER